MWKLRTALTAAIVERLKSYPAEQKKRRRSAHSALKRKGDSNRRFCFAKNKFLTSPEMCAIMAMQMESSICTHSEYVTAKGTGGFTVRFLFCFFQKTFQNKC